MPRGALGSTLEARSAGKNPAAATGSATYNLAYVYDPYGNMTCTQNQQTQGLCPQYGFNASTNQINNSGFSYDASGDLLSDNSHT